jgi:hypothetical protein
MKVFFGREERMVDITAEAVKKCLDGTTLTIPLSDGARTKLFTDVMTGAIKFIYIEDDDGTLTEYDEFTEVVIEDFVQ